MKKILEIWNKYVNSVNEDGLDRFTVKKSEAMEELEGLMRNIVRQGDRSEVRDISDLADMLQAKGLEADYDPMRARDPLRVSHKGEVFIIQTRDKALAPAAVVGRFAIDRT